MPKLTIRYTSEAKEDIVDLYDYIVDELMLPATANKYIDGILARINILSDVANAFSINPREYIQIKYGPSARTILYKKMVIIYNIKNNIVLIRRVMPSSLVL
jgi:plasmid stabilization system protein ParE